MIGSRQAENGLIHIPDNRLLFVRMQGQRLGYGKVGYLS
jgi:hypothetical protein